MGLPLIMRGSWQSWEIPHLSDRNGAITSPSSRRYNCIAWAAGSVHQWWWPDRRACLLGYSYWPPNIPVELTFEAFFRAYGTLGYILCADGALEQGVEKIAIYGKTTLVGVTEPTHAALQLPDGRWTSKLGPHEDIVHDTLSVIEGPTYGDAVHYMKRPRPVS